MNESEMGSAARGLRTDSRPNAILALSLVVPAPTLGVLAAMWLLQGRTGQSIYFLSKLWIIALPALWLYRVDRGRPIWVRPELRSVAVGFVLGLMLGAVIVGAYFGVGREWIDVELFRQKATENGLGTPARYIGFALYLCTINALVEEYVWRWFVFRKCEALVPGYPAVVLSALFFTVHHVFALAVQMPWRVTVLASAGVFVGGAVWSWCYLRYRSIWPGFVSHIVVDIGIFWIGWVLLFGEV